MSALTIEPAGSLVAVELLDDGDETEQQIPDASSGESLECILGICVGVGKEAKVCKRGDTVLLDPYARQGIKVGDSIRLIDSWYVKGIVKAPK